MTANGKISGGVLTVSSQIRRFIYMMISSADESALEKPLTTERELCERFHVARGTVRKAIELLVREKLLIRRPHYGTFIRPEVLQAKPSGKIISVIVGGGSNTWYDPHSLQVLRGICQRCIEKDIVVHPLEFWGDPELVLRTELAASFSGIIWLWSPVRFRKLYSMIENAGVPLVHIMPLAKDISGKKIFIDGESYGYGMAKRMIEAGFPDTLFLDDTASVYAGSREEGIRRACMEAGVSCHGSWRTVPASTVHEEAVKILSSGRFRAVNSTSRIGLLPPELAHILCVTPLPEMPEKVLPFPRPVIPLHDCGTTAFDMLFSGQEEEKIFSMQFAPFEKSEIQKKKGKRK